MKIILYGMLCIFIAGCNMPAKKKDLKQADQKDLIIKFELIDSLYTEKKPIKLSVEFINKGEQELSLGDKDQIENPILALNFFDKDGKELNTVPPPTPKNRLEDQKILGRGEKYQIIYTLNIFSPALSKGRYRAQMKRFPSKELWFEIKP